MRRSPVVVTGAMSIAAATSGCMPSGGTTSNPPPCETGGFGCEDSDTVDECGGQTPPDGDANCDGIYDGPTVINGIELDCTADPGDGAPNGAWWFTIETLGWTTGGDLTVAQTGSTDGWGEAHALPSVEWDEDRWWDRLGTELPIVTDASEQEADLTTLYECSTTRAQSLTWLVQVYDESGVRSDCAVWGHDPSFFLDQDDYASCIDWNA